MLKLQYLQHFYGVYRLLRLMPVIAWSGGAIGVGACAAYRESGSPFHWTYLGLAILVGVLMQGLVAHAYNDHSDWFSGTDKNSPGILSGGSRVIPEKYFNLFHLTLIGMLSLTTTLGIGVYLALTTGPWLWLFLGAGVWAALAYSLPPFRLAYRPFLGEWLAAWPAMVACSAGTTYLLSGVLSPLALYGGVLHATYSVGWLMQHHLPDIDADLAARPPKVTTVALVARRWGQKTARWVTAGYYALLMPLGAWGAVALHPVFAVSAVIALPAIALAVSTDPRDVGDITVKELRMIYLSLIHAGLLGIGLVA